MTVWSSFSNHSWVQNELQPLQFMNKQETLKAKNAS